MIFGVGIIIKVALLVGATIAGYSAHLVFKKPDTFIEQTSEKYIKGQTGWDVDFTPEKTESKKK